jgi:hypothetical protein
MAMHVHQSAGSTDFIQTPRCVIIKIFATPEKLKYIHHRPLWSAAVAWVSDCHLYSIKAGYFCLGLVRVLVDRPPQHT